MDPNHRARTAPPAHRGGQPVVLWDDIPVRFPLRRELILDASATDAPPWAEVVDGDGRVLATFTASLEDVIGGHPESAVLAEADAFIDRLTELRDRARPALGVSPHPRRRRLAVLGTAIVGIVAFLAYDGAVDRTQAAHTRELERALDSVTEAQESFHARFGRYADGFEELRMAVRLESLPPGTVVTIGRTSSVGYTATAAHPRARKVCTLERSPQATARRCE
jgi:hypothetical protein